MGSFLPEHYMVPRSRNNSRPKFLRKVSTRDYDVNGLNFELDGRLSHNEKALVRSAIS